MIARQFLAYILVGTISALTDVGLMRFFISIDINYLAATTFGFIAGLTVNFLLHARVTFKRSFSCCMLARYMTVVLVNFSLTLAIVEIFQNWLSMPVFGKIVALPLITVTGFLSSRYWIYKPNIKNR